MAATAPNSQRGRVSAKNLFYCGQPFSEAPQSKGFQPRGVWDLRAQLLGTQGASRKRADAFYWRHCWDGAIRCSSPGHQARSKTLQIPCSQPCFQAVEASTMITFKPSAGWAQSTSIDHLNQIGCLVTQFMKDTSDLRFWTGQPDSLGQTLFPTFFSRDLTLLLASEVKIYFFLSLEKVILCPSRGYR